MACAGATYGVAWLTGIGGVPSPTFLQRASFTLGLHGASATKIILYAFGYLAVMGLLNPGALGEEMGWRGFLLPELDRWLGFRRAALVTGVIWALWHWPAVIWGGYNVGTPLPYALVCLTAMVLAGSVIAAWLRLKSGSIWPCVIMHATHNALIQKFFDRITIEHAATRYFTTEFGVGLAIAMGIVAAYLWARMAAREEVSRPVLTSAVPVGAVAV
jgi:membrane protease YdiL (CAAX protease family)